MGVLLFRFSAAPCGAGGLLLSLLWLLCILSRLLSEMPKSRGCVCTSGTWANGTDDAEIEMEWPMLGCELTCTGLLLFSDEAGEEFTLIDTGGADCIKELCGGAEEEDEDEAAAYAQAADGASNTLEWAGGGPEAP